MEEDFGMEVQIQFCISLSESWHWTLRKSKCYNRLFYGGANFNMWFAFKYPPRVDLGTTSSPRSASLTVAHTIIPRIRLTDSNASTWRSTFKNKFKSCQVTSWFHFDTACALTPALDVNSLMLLSDWNVVKMRVKASRQNVKETEIKLGHFYSEALWSRNSLILSSSELLSFLSV